MRWLVWPLKLVGVITVAVMVVVSDPAGQAAVGWLVVAPPMLWAADMATTLIMDTGKE